jgi:hypothetical protein
VGNSCPEHSTLGLHAAENAGVDSLHMQPQTTIMHHDQQHLQSWRNGIHSLAKHQTEAWAADTRSSP